MKLTTGDVIEKGETIVEFSPKYEHDLAAGVQRVVVLVFQQKQKIDTSTMTIFDKVRIYNFVCKILVRVNSLIFTANTHFAGSYSIIILYKVAFKLGMRKHYRL